MGADIIIGVDVQNDLKPANELNSTGSILGATHQFNGTGTL